MGNTCRKDTIDDDALDGITANDMMISVLERANRNLREIEKIALEIRAMLFLSREHIKDCAIGVIALALTRHVAPEAYMELTNLDLMVVTQRRVCLVSYFIGQEMILQGLRLYTTCLIAYMRMLVEERLGAHHVE